MIMYWNKLKPGDKLVCISNTYIAENETCKLYGLTIGKIYIVIKYFSLERLYANTYPGYVMI